MIKPLISIIIPNYNHSDYLVSRLESVYNQIYQDFEVILLDDCSTDKSKEILEEYKDHSKTAYCLFNKENSGSPFKQWDKGINLAKGSIIWIAETDDFCEPDFLEKTLKPLIKDMDIALSYCQSHRMNAYGEVTGSWLTHTDQFTFNIFSQDFEMQGNQFIENYLIHKNVIPNVSAVLFRKSLLKRILPLTFEPYMKYNADWYYYIQLLCNSKLAFISDSLNYFRYHDNSVISRAGGESGWLKIFKMELRGRQNMLNYLKNNNPANLVRIKKQAKTGNKRLHFLIAKGYINSGKYNKAISIVIDKPQLLKKIVKIIIKDKL